MANNPRPFFTKEPLISLPGTGNFIAPASGTCTVLTANTATDGTGSLGSTLIQIATIPAEGAVLNKLIFTHLGTNIATLIRVFINNGANVANAFNNTLFYEQPMAANTLSQTVPSAQIVFDQFNQGYRIPGGSIIYATTGITIAAGIKIIALFDGLSV